MVAIFEHVRNQYHLIFSAVQLAHTNFEFGYLMLSKHAILTHGL